MTTQTLFGIVGTEPLHWRGDRQSLADFNPAFEGLLGDDKQLTTQEMEQFEAFVATLKFPPNPYRNLDGSLNDGAGNASLPLPGNAVVGEELFLFDSSKGMKSQGFNCVGCHAVPTGTNSLILQPIFFGGITQNTKTAQLQNLYDKVGVKSGNKGFGFLHDGSIQSCLLYTSPSPRDS